MRVIGWFLIIVALILHFVLCQWTTFEPGGGALVEGALSQVGAVWSNADWGVAILPRGGNVALSVFLGISIPVVLIVGGFCLDYAGAKHNKRVRIQRRHSQV